jgi:hypothetical protein
MIAASGVVSAITGVGQTTTNNGHFFTRPGCDLATGIGTPIMAALITETP